MASLIKSGIPGVSMKCLSIIIILYMDPSKIIQGVIVAQKAFEVGEKVLSGGYGFAIPA